MLHVEFQVSDEPEMVYRMAEYSIMLMRRYQLPVKQYVIFLKDIEPNMPVSIDTEHHQFGYTLIRIAEADYKLFQKSDNPEVKMLGILANFGKDNTYKALKSIVDGIKSTTNSNFAESRYFRQLRIFVQLRNNIEQQLEKAMESVSTFFKEENDFLFRRGEERGKAINQAKSKAEGEIIGEARGIRKTATNMKNSGIDITLIANITGLSIEEIEKL